MCYSSMSVCVGMGDRDLVLCELVSVSGGVGDCWCALAGCLSVVMAWLYERGRGV